MNMRKRVVAGLSAACLAVALAMTGAPAQASVPPKLTVCNSTASVGWIYVYAVPTNVSQEDFLWKGECGSFPNTSNNVRVDVDPEAGSPDVDSYYIGVIGSGYGPCHQGENDSSDPPNDAPNGVRYNTNAGSC